MPPLATLSASPFALRTFPPSSNTPDLPASSNMTDLQTVATQVSATWARSCAGSQPIRSATWPAKTIRIAIYADPHGKRYLPQEKVDCDLVLLGGDMSYQPIYPDDSCPKPSVTNQIDDINHFKKMYDDGETVLVAIPGNHDHLVQEAFGFKSPAPVTDPEDDSKRRWRNSASEEDLARIREAYQTNESQRYYFEQHGRLSITVKDHPLNLFLSGLSHHRCTDGYVFHEKDVTAQTWEELTADIDILMTHGPMAFRMSELKLGDILLDRDDDGPCGSVSLRAAAFRAQPSLIVNGHIHNAYGHQAITFDDSSTGLAVNAASVLHGGKRKMGLSDDRLSEYLTPRPPIVVDFDTETKQCTVVSSWDGCVGGEKVNLPPWCGSIAGVLSTGNRDSAHVPIGKSAIFTDEQKEQDRLDYERHIKASGRKGVYTQEAGSVWLDTVKSNWNLRAKALIEARVGGLRDWSEDDIEKGTWTDTRART